MESRTRSWLRSPGLWSGVLAIGISLAVLVWVHSIGGPAAVRERYGLLAPLISFATHTVGELVPGGDLIPFGIANGTLYGVAEGALISWLAWMVSAAIQYLVARRTALDLDLARRLEELPAWLRRFPLDHPAFLIGARWFPMVGPIANVAAGALGVSMLRLMWCTALGAAPVAIGLAAFGAGMLRAL
jgi:uncharacterized membrane protein YdjX (TVP38/TMEM64 family)